MKPKQQIVQSLVDQFVSEGTERGLQIAAYQNGELIVDAFAGVAEANKPVKGDTLFPVFSTTKGIAATVLHLLVERGKVSYDTRIAEVWPEFAAHGKGEIQLRHAMNHTSGVANMPLGIGHAALCDWDAMCVAMANEKPLSEPGVEMAYHAITYSWTLGEVARRVDGRPFAQILREEIAAPLGLADDLFIGIPDSAESRVAFLDALPPTVPSVKDDGTPQAIPFLVQPLEDWMNRSDARRACIPASNGIMTARAVAKHYAALLPGGVDGIELLPPERIRLATEWQKPRHLKPGESPMNQGLGYQIRCHNLPTAFGHNGYGGSIGFASLEDKLAVGFARDRFSETKSLELIIEALRK